MRNTNNAGIIRQNSLICGSVATLPHLKEAGKLVWAYDQDVSSRLHLSVSLGWHGDGGWEKRGLGFIPQKMDGFFLILNVTFFFNDVLIKNLMKVSYSNSTFHLFGYLLMH